MGFVTAETDTARWEEHVRLHSLPLPPSQSAVEIEDKRLKLKLCGGNLELFTVGGGDDVE